MKSSRYHEISLHTMLIMEAHSQMLESVLFFMFVSASLFIFSFNSSTRLCLGPQSLCNSGPITLKRRLCGKGQVNVCCLDSLDNTDAYGGCCTVGFLIETHLQHFPIARAFRARSRQKRLKHRLSGTA